MIPTLAIGPSEILTIQFFLFALVLLPLLALMSVFRNDFEGNRRYFWAAVIILIPIIGSILYLFIGRQQRLRRAM